MLQTSSSYSSVWIFIFNVLITFIFHPPLAQSKRMAKFLLAGLGSAACLLMGFGQWTPGEVPSLHTRGPLCHNSLGKKNAHPFSLKPVLQTQQNGALPTLQQSKNSKSSSSSSILLFTSGNYYPSFVPPIQSLSKKWIGYVNQLSLLQKMEKDHVYMLYPLLKKLYMVYKHRHMFMLI